MTLRQIRFWIFARLLRINTYRLIWHRSSLFGLKCPLYMAAVCGVLILVSWGYKGHRAIATIAQKYLTSNTAYLVSGILNGEAVADTEAK